MTDEELKYIKSLQPLFKKVMGEWQGGDWYYDNLNNYYGCVEDAVVEDFNNKSQWSGMRFYLIIPPPIDRTGQGRDLISMIKGFGSLRFNGSEWECVCYNGTTSADTPTLALLKAIAAQEGITL